MKNKGIWLAAAITFLFTLTGSVYASSGARISADAIQSGQPWRAEAGWWTCYIERPLFYYIGWAHERADAVTEAIKACTEDGIVCEESEAVCSFSDDR